MKTRNDQKDKKKFCTFRLRMNKLNDSSQKCGRVRKRVSFLRCMGWNLLPMVNHIIKEKCLRAKLSLWPLSRRVAGVFPEWPLSTEMECIIQGTARTYIFHPAEESWLRKRRTNINERTGSCGQWRLLWITEAEGAFTLHRWFVQVL